MPVPVCHIQRIKYQETRTLEEGVWSDMSSGGLRLREQKSRTECRGVKCQ